MRRPLILPLIMLLTFSSCASLPVNPNLSIAAKAGAPLPKDYYDYPDDNPELFLIRETQERHFVRRLYERELILPEALQSDDRKLLTEKIESIRKTDPKRARNLDLTYVNRLEYFKPASLPAGEKRPVILISPILGGNMVVDRFAYYYTGRGYLALIVHRQQMEWDETRGFEQVEDYLRTSILRLRQALDWLEEQPEVDASRIGTIGISYGAILNSVLAASDDRIQAHIFALPAAPLADVIVDCPENSIKNLMKQVKAQYGYSKEEIRRRLQEVIRTDPGYFADQIPTEKVQFYYALFDRVVGTRRSKNLWEAMGKPERTILPFGHYGGALLFPYLQTQSFRFFQTALEAPEND